MQQNVQPLHQKESSRLLVVIRKQDTSHIRAVSGNRRKKQEKKNQITSTDLLNYNINTKNSMCGMSTRKEWETRQSKRASTNHKFSV